MTARRRHGGTINVPGILASTIKLLDEQPRRYKLFGVWWWPVKALLKQRGYTTTDLYMLGDYVDGITAAMVPPASLEDTLRAAVAEYGQNACYPRSDGTVEAPDGAFVILHDEDAGV